VVIRPVSIRFGLRLLVAGAVFLTAGLSWRLAFDRSDPWTAWFAAIATALAALALSGASGAIERMVDRICLGRTADPTLAVRDLLRRMADTVPVEDVLPRLAEATSRSAGQSHAEVAVSLADGAVHTTTWPPGTPLGSGAVSVPVTHDGSPIGRLTVEPPSADSEPRSRRLLAELAGPAGIALATVRLTEDLRARQEDLRRVGAEVGDAQQRLLTARRDEQDRLRREIDQRVNPDLQMVADLLARTPVGDGADSYVEHALDMLRSIARGIYPPRLDEAGLAVAVGGWLDRRGPPAALDITPDVDPTLDSLPELRPCLYFCMVTLLDAAQGAGITGLTVTVRRNAPATTAADDGEIRFTVDGAGWLDPDQPAVQVTRDRVESFDGRMSVARPPDPLVLITLPTVGVAG